MTAVWTWMPAAMESTYCLFATSVAFDGFDIPVIEPPVIATELAAWNAMLATVAPLIFVTVRMPVAEIVPSPLTVCADAVSAASPIRILPSSSPRFSRMAVIGMASVGPEVPAKRPTTVPGGSVCGQNGTPGWVWGCGG
jgi:hypothetical protein